MKCPHCGSPCDCDTADIGVSVQQIGPWYCADCRWTEPPTQTTDMLKAIFTEDESL